MNLSAVLSAAVQQKEWEGGDYFFPVQASSNAARVDDLYYFIFWVSLVAFVAICAATAYFAFKYRRSKVGMVPEDSPHHSVSIEIVWSVIPALLMVWMFWLGFVDYVDRRTMPEDAMQIDVTATKWSWSFRYPNGAELPGKPADGVWDADGTNDAGLHVPPYEPVVFRINATDVLHSFSVPAMRVKMDGVPGRYTYAWFEATMPGTYELYCTEYCGTQHSQMLSKVIVHPSRADYDAWVAGKVVPVAPTAEYGEHLYNLKGCLACHSLDGTAIIGPSFQGSYGASRSFTDGTTGVVDDNYIRESILNPNAKVVEGFAPAMPPFQGQIDDVGIAALIEFIKAQQ